MMIGNPVRQYESYPTQAAADAWYEQIVQRAYTTDTNNKLYYYDASSDYNPSPDLETIRAKLLLILFADDQVNSPAFGVLEREMPQVTNGRYVIILAGKQSNEERSITSTSSCGSYLEDFLRSLRH
jgi:homoserine O-acetyltransferase/O-succinyltransferase